jgi:DMSO/TMAO reductase YedYZ heme-binding membrane subunit
MSAAPVSTAPKTHRDTLLLLGVGIALAAWCVIAYRAGGYYVQRDLFACQLSGYAALGYLAASLCSGPVWILLGRFGYQVDREFSARFSRNAGIAAALAASLHTVIALTTYLQYDWLVALQIPYLQWGGLALLVLLVLLVGSFKPLMGWLRWKLWKPLFRLSFLAAILTLPHVFYAPFSSSWLILLLYCLALLISLIRWIPLWRAAVTKK